MPKTGYPESRELQWLFAERDQYRNNGGHPLYGETDITYRLNSHGYRCPEFDQNANIRILSIGDSNTFGVGLPQPAVYHERFADSLRQSLSRTVVNWNLGLCGSSNDYISRVLHVAVPLLDPHVVLVKYTYLSRREYVTATGRYCNYTSKFTPSDPVMKEVFAHFASLSSAHDDELNFYRNYKSVETLLKERVWLFSFCTQAGIEPVLHFTDRSRFAGLFPKVDKARDGGHYGPETHRQFYEGFWNKLVETYGLEQFA
jgi:hypothetical protein